MMKRGILLLTLNLVTLAACGGDDDEAATNAATTVFTTAAATTVATTTAAAPTTVATTTAPTQTPTTAATFTSTVVATMAASTTEAAPLGAPLPDELIGTWKSTISDADAAVIAQQAGGFDRPGLWLMVLSATTFQFLNPEKDSPGSYPVGLSATNEITVAPELDCPGQTTQDGGQYAYQTDGETLTLTPLRDDSCPFREWLLIAHPWQKRGG